MRAEANKPKKVEAKKKPPPIEAKIQPSLPDPDLWEKVKAGLQIMMIGSYVWAASILFIVIVLLIGVFAGPEEYGDVLVKAMGEKPAPDTAVFMLDLAVGTGSHGMANTLCILAAVLSMFQFVVIMAGAGLAAKVPDRFGMPGQAKALAGLCIVNLLVVLIFQLLPLLGISGLYMVPTVLPQVSLADVNINRALPLWVFWSPSPFWEMTLTVVLLVMYYAAPVLIGSYVWSIGMALKEDPIARAGQGFVNLTLGVAFTLLAYHLLTMTGTSGVAVGPVAESSLSVGSLLPFCFWYACP